MKTKLTNKAQRIEIHIDGAGARPDGEGSGFAWTAPKLGKSAVEWKDGLTNNQAEYSAFVAALLWLPINDTATVFSDSQLVCEQFNGLYQVRNSALAILLGQARDLIRQKSLHIEVKWIPRSSNLAGKLLKRNISHKARAL